ncbi:DedA family protein [Spongiactinospora sp. 9N601]|uniref:DedA family protein n=1 Tax=Spongiactinospora sp. 9N601 TaxID=3375149 RepID=UPI00378C54F1
MTDAILNFLHQVMTSPWVYVALFAVAMIDGFFPVVPSETAIITAGVFAVSGEPNVFGVAVAAMLGAFAGDHVSYLIGRTGGVRLRARLRPGTGRAKAFDWAERALAERGGLVLVVARYIPGGRTATTISMGTVGYPLRSFSFFDTLAAGSWAIYSVLIGYLGGMAFENDPFKGLLLGLGIALTITVVVEVTRYVRKRKNSGKDLKGEPEAELTRRQG